MEEIAMRNRWQTAGLLIAAAFLAAACGPFTSSSGSSGSGYGSAPSSKAAAPSSGQATLKTAQSSAGTILANAGGYVLYYYSADKPGSGTSACTGSCATAWPPLTGTVKTPTGMTLPGPLGAITLAGGKKQVTINGYPIYLYAGDHSPGQANGNGVGGKWHVIKIAGSSGTSTAVTLKTAQTSGGTILTSAGGYALYYYSEDKPGSGTSVCTGSCATAWPPLTGTVQAPPGVTLPGPLGTITRADGTKQVTIKGYPIYLYAGDHSAGQDSGNGVGGVWHVVKISGSPSSSSSSPSPSPSSGSSSSTSGAGGYGGGGY
jgi:predicted lipoprotein with Yx(FWY)xxD motif